MDLPEMAAWNKHDAPAATGASGGGDVARQMGLTFRELLSMRAEPAPAITAAGLRRLQASPAEKRRRAEARDDPAFRRDLARKRR